MDIDLLNEPLGQDLEGRDVFLKDIWPAREEIQSLVRKSLSKEMFSQEYSEVFTGDDRWLALDTPLGQNYAWDPASSYVKAPPFFEGMTLSPPPLKDISKARVLVKVGDTLTTDHISPAGAIPDDSPAGRYLIERGIEPEEFNSFGSRRGRAAATMKS
jgi:aconitate hydratase